MCRFLPVKHSGRAAPNNNDKIKELIKFLKVVSSGGVRGLYAAVAVRLSKVDVKESLFTKRIKLPGNQSKCETLFDVSLPTSRDAVAICPFLRLMFIGQAD